MFESSCPTGWGPCSTQTSFSKIIITITLFPSCTQLLGLLMINPFISNTTNQYLFRKNYQLLQPQSPIPTPSYTPSQYAPIPTDTQLLQLQNRNPFHSKSPAPTLSTSNYVSPPQRPISANKSPLSISQGRFTGAKGGLLETADSWKRQLQKTEREKVQVYGAQGLRYNGYIGSAHQKNESSDYYQLSAKPIQAKPQINFRLAQQDSTYGNYLSPREQIHPPKPKQKPKPEYFQDEIQQQSPNFHLVDPRKEQKDDNLQQSRHSRVNDMFESQFDDRYKRPMQYNSFYGGPSPQQMLQSRGGLLQNSRYAEPNVYRPYQVQQSSVRRMEVNAPQWISVRGIRYQRINL